MFFVPNNIKNINIYDYKFIILLIKINYMNCNASNETLVEGEIF